ncbi:MAG: hypothetical protein C0623_04210 [Desulfuromonas sp.]|nr:MAG: hypothetical protein C0623_04210 [Desulfuromonas sp.]
MTTGKAGHRLTYGRIFLFWSPLALTWILMAIEGPYLAALIARLPEAVVNLAAYGVAFAFALVAEAPVIMLMAASTALCRGQNSYRKLRWFTVLLSLGVTLLLALISLPPVFNWLGVELIGLQPEVASKVNPALWALLPWPGAIGFRRFYQGVLIADGRTRRVTIGTITRVVAMTLAGLTFAVVGPLPGSVIGALALSVGVVVEALVTRQLAKPSITAYLERHNEAEPLSMATIWHYYLPLALTPFIALSVQPVITFFLSRGAFPLESLAVLPVLYGLTFIFRALGLSYQEAAIALLGPHLEEQEKVGRFALLLGISCVGILGLIALTPLADLWLRTISGLTPELVSFSRLPLILMVLMPGLTVWITWQRSRLLVMKQTGPISTGTLLEAAVILLVLATTISHVSWPGIILAALALTAGRLAGILYLAFFAGNDRLIRKK